MARLYRSGRLISALNRAIRSPREVIPQISRFAADPLESRLLLAANAWKMPVSGDWDTPGNWTLGHVPTAAEDVNIAVAGSYTVTHSSGASDSAHTLTLSHPVNFTAGSLTVGSILANNTNFTLAGGELVNATLNASNGGKYVPTSGTFSHVTLGTDLSLANAAVINVVKGLLLNGHKITLNSSANYTGFVFNDTAAQSLSGPGQIDFAGTTPNNDFFNTQGTAANPVTLAANVTISASGGLIQNTAGVPVPAGLIIQSPITLASAGGILSISTFTNKGTITVSAGTFNPGGAWANQGTIAVTGASATVNLGGTFSTVGTINHTAGSVNLTGTDTVNGTLALTTATGSWNLMGGTIINATLSLTGGATLVPTSSPGTLNHVTLAGDLSFPNNGQIYVVKGLALNGHTITLNSSGAYTGITFNDPAAQIVSGPGTFVFAGSTPGNDYFNSEGAAANPVTLATNVTISASGGLIQNTAGVPVPAGLIIQSPITLASAGGILSISTFTNKGTITVSAGTFNPGGAWANQGTIAVTGASATVNLGGTFSSVGTINHTAGKVNITGVLTTNTLALTATTGSWGLAGGTIANATLTYSGGASLLFSGSSGTLSHVTLGTDLSFPNNGQINVVKGLLLNNHKITLNSTGAYTGISFNGPAAQAVTGPGQIIFAGTSPGTDYLNCYGTAASPLTFGAGVMISGTACLIQALGGPAAGLINAGTITDTGAGSFNIGNFTNRGTFAATGGNISVTGPVNNTGTITVSGGHTITLNGTATLTNTGTGVLSGTGTIIAPAFINSATISPGATPLVPGAPSIGTLTLKGVFTQTASGVIHEELGGANAGQFDRLIVNGAATLAGLLDVYLVNGFHPAVGKMFNVFGFTSHTGTLNTDGLSLGGSTALKSTINPTNVTLSAIAIPADTTKPTISAPTLVGGPHAGAVTLTFKVTYSDNTAIDVSTLGAGDLKVTGPNAFSQLATFVGVSKANNGTPRVATYKLTLAVGNFKAGTYTVAAQAGAVKDSKGNAIATGAGGTFILPA